MYLNQCLLQASYYSVHPAKDPYYNFKSELLMKGLAQLV